MSNEEKLHLMTDKLVAATLAELARRALPMSGHQVAGELYAILDRYADAVVKNKGPVAKQALEELAVTTLKSLYAYQRNAPSVTVDQVRVQSTTKDTAKS